MILITRPQEEALRTQQRLELAGYKCKIFPLLEIIIKENIIKDCHWKEFDYILITSQNAIKALAAAKARFQTPILVVGQKTAGILTQEGFNIVGVFATTEDLKEFVIKGLKRDLKLLYLAGDVTVQPLSEQLQNIGFNIIKKIIYESKEVNILPSYVIQDIKIILFYSPRTAQIFAKLCHLDLSTITAICISDNVAKKITKLNFGAIKIAPHPNENAIFSLLI